MFLGRNLYILKGIPSSMSGDDVVNRITGLAAQIEKTTNMISGYDLSRNDSGAKKAIIELLKVEAQLETIQKNYKQLGGFVVTNCADKEL